LHIVSATRLVIRGTVTFGIMRAGIIHTFVRRLFGGRATGVGVKGCVAVTFEFPAAGVGTDGSGIRTFRLRIGIGVVAALRKIGIVIRTETNGILPGSTSTGLTKAQGFATINIVVIKFLFFVIKTHLVRRIDHKMNLSGFIGGSRLKRRKLWPEDWLLIQIYEVGA